MDSRGQASATNTHMNSLPVYKQRIQKVIEDVKVLESQVAGLIEDEDTDTGLLIPPNFNPFIDLLILLRHRHCMVADVIGSYVSDGETKFMVELHQTPIQYVVGVDPCSNIMESDVKTGMRVGLSFRDHSISEIYPPPKDAFLNVVEVVEKPEVTFEMIGGYKEQMTSLREMFVGGRVQSRICRRLRIQPPKGALLYGPPGTGKTMMARAVANASDSTFIRVVSTELVKKNLGEGARLVREIFNYARTKPSCIIFIDEVDAIGGSRLASSSLGEDTEVQRIMLELINQLDGFDDRGNVKVIMATNREETLDAALLRPGRLDRRIEFGPPDFESRLDILKKVSAKMPKEENIRFDLVARKSQNLVAADMKCICTEAGLSAIRNGRRTVTEKDFLFATDKVNEKKFNDEGSLTSYN